MVYKYTDIVGTTNTDITDAVNNAFREAAKTVYENRVSRIKNSRVTFRIKEGEKIEYQAEVRIGFKVLR